MARIIKMGSGSKNIELEARRAGSLDLSSIAPNQAAALWQLNLLNEDDVLELADNWLMNGSDQGSDELAAIAVYKPKSVVEVKPALERAFAQMGVAPLSEDEAILIALEIHLHQIVTGGVLPMCGMTALDKLYIDKLDNRDGIVIRHPKFVRAKHKNYMGSQCGLEYLYTWYREFQDAFDDATWYYNELPFEAQLDKFDANVIEEAKVILEHLHSMHPTLPIG